MVARQLLQDILVLRNQHLLEALDMALPEYQRVVIPWGAYHLPDIEEGLEQRGFTQTGERRHTLIPFGQLGGVDDARDPTPRSAQ